jgi:hypothetical protein
MLLLAHQCKLQRCGPPEGLSKELRLAASGYPSTRSY